MTNAGWYWNRIKSYIGRPRTVIQQQAVIIRDDDICDRPLFILGAHRSGTSLLRRMVNSHPEIACPPESFMIAQYAKMMDDDLCRAGYDGFGYDLEAMRQDLEWRARSLHEAFRIAQGKQIWADKTPHYLSVADDIDRLFNRRPRYLLIYRHPCSIVHSIYKRGWKFNDIDDPFEAAIEYVRESMARLQEFESTHSDRCASIDYRQLCHDPERELRRSLEKLDLRYDSDMLDFGNKPHNFGLEDPVIRGKPTIEISEGAWESWSRAKKQRAAAAFGPRAMELDYWVGW